MNTISDSCEPAVDVLRELFSSATHDASAAMCRWTNGLIQLTLDDILDLDICEVISRFQFSDSLMTMILLKLEGEMGGDIILTFDDTNGRHLAASLLGREPSSEVEWTDLEISALKETGNILGCAFLNALTRIIGAELVPSAPCFVQDYGASVFQQALMQHAMTSDRIVICRTGFHRDGKDLDWNVFFLPTPSLREAMEHTLNGNNRSLRIETPSAQ